MSGDASADRKVPSVVNVPIEGGGRPIPGAPSGSYEFQADLMTTGWHGHAMHQLEYAVSGVAEVETERFRYLVPPQQAIWIPAGIRHRTTLQSSRSISVFFSPDIGSLRGIDATVLPASALIREMILYSRKWPVSNPEAVTEGRSFFECLLGVLEDASYDAEPLSLPSTTDALVALAMDLTRRDLAASTPESIAAAVGVSERTLRRRFLRHTGITWSSYQQQARLLRAMLLLVESDATVLRIATSVGFTSVSAFTRAFRGLTGETPAMYRRRVQRASGAGRPRRDVDPSESEASPGELSLLLGLRL